MLKKLFLGAFLALGLAVTAGEVSAAGYHGGHGRPYYATAGVRFSSGYYYRGRDHHHFAPRVWNARYDRYHYFDPSLRCYYYWSRPHGCYFPVGSPIPY